MVRHGKNGMLFRPGEPSGLADAVEAFVAGGRQSALSRGALKSSREYSIERVTGRVEGIYRGLVEGGRRGKSAAKH
jgi:glycosyltransferase involved in cell wall biosynthesis